MLLLLLRRFHDFSNSSRVRCAVLKLLIPGQGGGGIKKFRFHKRKISFNELYTPLCERGVAQSLYTRRDGGGLSFRSLKLLNKSAYAGIARGNIFTEYNTVLCTRVRTTAVYWVTARKQNARNPIKRKARCRVDEHCYNNIEYVYNIMQCRNDFRDNSVYNNGDIITTVQVYS